MKKILVALIAAGVVSIAASSPAAAQTQSAIVKVPFQFIVGHAVLPAGRYRIAPQTPDWKVVSITNLNGLAGAFIFTQALVNSEPTTDGSQVTFKRYDGHYFLQGVVVPGRDARQVVITKAGAERTLAKLNMLNGEPANVAK